MRILINGESKEFDEGIALSDLIELLELPSQRIAVELNREVVRRADWKNTVLRDEDRLEIVHFVGGGSGFVGAFLPRPANHGDPSWNQGAHGGTPLTN